MIRFFISILALFFYLSGVAQELDLNRLKVSGFSENKGQWDSNVLFKAKMPNGNLWLEKNCITFNFQNPDDLERISQYKHDLRNTLAKNIKLDYTVRNHSFNIIFVGCNTEITTSSSGIHKDYENYYLGNDSTRWTNNVRKYDKVRYKDIYKEIDIVFHSGEGLKYDLIVKPGASIDQIDLLYKGVSGLSLKEGNLLIKTEASNIIELKPFAYQIINGDTVKVKCEYKLVGNHVKYLIKGDYNKNQDLIIDPVLAYCSYTGSYADNWGYTATYDSYGFIYTGGTVFGQNYPITTGAYQTSFGTGTCDISITKFDTLGSALIFSTYLGGNKSEVPSSLVCNDANELYVLGITGSSNFPVSAGAFDQSFNGGSSITATYAIDFTLGTDLCLTKFNAAGTQLLGSTFFGGTANDGMNTATQLKKNYADEVRGEVQIDNSGNVYIVSSTHSTNIPTSNFGFQPVKSGGQDGLIAKFDYSLSTLMWASYYGGNGDDAIYAVNFDSQDNVFICGGTLSTTLATNANSYFQTNQGGATDGFIAKIASNGTNLIRNTYFGTPFYDQVYFIDNDLDDNIFVYGQTADTGSLLIYNTLFNVPGGGQFLTKFDNNLQNIIWSTNWGNASNSGPDVTPSAFMVDYCGKIYMSAWGGQTNTFGSTSGLPVSTNAFKSTTDGSDYYFLVLENDASAIDYATFFGGNIAHEHVDGGTSRFDKKGSIYQAICAGCGGYSDLPTTVGCHSAINHSSNCNNAVVKFKFDVEVVIADFMIPPPSVGCAPHTVVFDNNSYAANSATYYWDFGDGTASNQLNPTHTYTNGGIYDVTLIVNDPLSCNLSDTVTKQLAVIENGSDTLPAQEICIGDFIQIGILPISGTNISYTWDHGNSLSSTSISNPIATPTTSTWYHCYFTNSICTDTLTQFVKVLNISVDAGNDTSLCYNTITLTGNSNESGLDWQWSSNPNFTDTLNINGVNTLTTTINDSTWFWVRGSRLTCSDFDSVLVTPLIYISNSTNINPKCHGDADGSLGVTATGGVLPHTYLWNNGSTQSSQTNLSAGTYVVTVTDFFGCYASDSIILTQPDSLIIVKSWRNAPCADICKGEAVATPQGGSLPYSWSWNDPFGQTASHAINLCAGSYDVVVTDANGCMAFENYQIIDTSVFIILNAQIADDTVYEGQSVQITSTNLGQGFYYSWNPPTGLNSPTIHNPIATPLVTTEYILTVTDDFGCIFFDTVFIFTIDVTCEEPYIFVPNAFTPDNDGLNDILYARSSVGYEVDLKIYDRWGEKVFETTDLNNGWDGTFKGMKCDPGVFTYYLNLVCYNKETFKKKGNITLIR